jgi:sialic acid synthase SpsE
MQSARLHLPCLIITEVGSVHDGSFGNARKLIDIATQCGADAVKFQTHIAAAETLRDAPMPAYFRGEPRYEYFERTSFTKEQWQDLKSYCEEQKVEFLSSPFSIEAVQLLETVGVVRHKIPSGEVSNLPLLEAIAETGKPVFLSSGMSSWEELDTAVNTFLRRHSQLTVLQCTSEYPCPYEEVGLNVMLEMRDQYRLPLELCDHTLTGYTAPVVDYDSAPPWIRSVLVRFETHALLRERCRRFALENFTLELQAARYQELYQNLLEERHVRTLN